jgi:hypothetical protein
MIFKYKYSDDIDSIIMSKNRLVGLFRERQMSLKNQLFLSIFLCVHFEIGYRHKENLGLSYSLMYM